jgi:hypothetical protein
MIVAAAKGSRRLAWPAALALLLFGAAGISPAQLTKLGGEKAAVEEPYRKYQISLDKYLTGERVASGPGDREAVEAATAAAKWFVYRLTWWDVQQVNREFLPILVRDFDRSFMDYAVRSAGKNKEFMRIFDRKMIAAFKELMALDFKDYRIAQINGALLLPILARYGDEAVGDYLTEMLKDAGLHDALKVHALKALKEFFAARPPRVDETADDEKDRQRDAVRVAAVLAFLTRKGPENASPEEVEAARFIRREAIKALAQTRVPAMAVQKTKVQVPVALGLLKVLAPEANGLAPSSSLSEKSEAAIGLCRLKAGAIEQYKPEAAVYLVGKFLVEFAQKYKEDSSNFIGVAKDRKPPLLPWKYHAERLEQALKELQKNAKNADGTYQAKLSALVTNSLPLLAKMKRHDAVDDTALLEAALSKIWPKAPALPLFQGVPSVQILVPPLKESP